MLEKIFADLDQEFVPGAVKEDKSFYFSLGEMKKTVEVSATACKVSDGRVVDEADCVCKTSPEFFLKIWNEGYRPGMKDFFSGTIKSNDPTLLKDFLKAFGKDAE